MMRTVVVYVNYNTTHLIVESIKRSSFVGFDVVVVDNSELDSGDYVHSETKSLGLAGVKYIHGQGNVGFGPAVNLAVKYLSGIGYEGGVLLLNSDAYVISGIGKINSLVEGNKIVGALLVRVNSFDEIISEDSRIQACGGSSALKPFDWGRPLNEGESLRQRPTTACALDGYVNGAFMLMKFDVLESLGGFDESYFMWFEEVDLCIRAKAAGVGLYFDPDIWVGHLVGGSSASDRKSSFCGRVSTRNSFDRFKIRGYYHIRNEIILVRKNYGLSVLLSGVHIIFVGLVKRIFGVLLYDDRKLSRCILLIRAVIDGFLGRSGKVL